MDQFSRTRMLLDSEGVEHLRKSRVAVFGVGGVGGYVAEALARSGVGALTLVDNDTVSLTNLNRQMVALHSTLGRSKVEVMAARLRDINPEAEIIGHEMFYLPENADTVDLTAFDYVVDAVDTVAAKLELITRCTAAGVPILCAMGAGNKLDPTQLQITDIGKTSVCPLAKVIRVECRKRGIQHLEVAWSTEPAITPACCEEDREESTKRSVPGSWAVVPACMGLMMAGHVLRRLAAGKEENHG